MIHTLAPLCLLFFYLFFCYSTFIRFLRKYIVDIFYIREQSNHNEFIERSLMYRFIFNETLSEEFIVKLHCLIFILYIV